MATEWQTKEGCRVSADYKIVNIKELEDMAVKFGLSPNLEARFGRKATDAKQGGFSYQKLAPDFRQPFGHRHEGQEEFYVVLSGGGRITLAGETHDLKPFDVVRVAPRVGRGFEAGPDGLEFIVFGAGETGDAEMIESFWEDAAGG
jgi:mannose-6-phosphate isomerase-like protein (cupin superfamily)